MEITGYIAAIFIGIALGLLGGGGSILTLPVLVYLFHIEPTITAPAYSLFVVGVTSLIGALINYKAKLVHSKMVFIFGLPAIISVYLTRKFLVPWIPDILIATPHFVLSKRLFVMGLFALLMLAAAISMIKKKKDQEETLKKLNYSLIILEGVIVGVLTGIVGAGGGFIIVPALVLLSGLSMKKAIGTSLAIIAIKSLSGFVGDLTHITIEWNLLILFSTLTIVGLFVGHQLSNNIKETQLKKGFGIFIFVMGCYILIKETFLI